MSKAKIVLTLLAVTFAALLGLADTASAACRGLHTVRDLCRCGMREKHCDEDQRSKKYCRTVRVHERPPQLASG
jgi:hypothetical protein